MRWSQVLNVVDVHCGGENARVVPGAIGDDLRLLPAQLGCVSAAEAAAR